MEINHSSCKPVQRFASTAHTHAGLPGYFAADGSVPSYAYAPNFELAASIRSLAEENERLSKPVRAAMLREVALRLGGAQAMPR